MSKLTKHPVLITFIAIVVVANMSMFAVFIWQNEQTRKQILLLTRRHIMMGDLGTAKELMNGLVPSFLEEFEIFDESMRSCPDGLTSVPVFYDSNSLHRSALICIRTNHDVILLNLFLLNGFSIVALMFGISIQRKFRLSIEIAEQKAFDSFLRDLEDVTNPTTVDQSDGRSVSDRNLRVKSIVNRFARQSVALTKQKEISRIASQIAHDLRSPLSALNMVAHSSKDLPDAERSLIQQVSKRIAFICEDLLRKNRESSQEPGSVLLYDAISSVVHEVRISVGPKDIDFIIECDNQLRALAVEGSLKRVLVNLINNSVEAITQAGALHLTARIDGDYVLIEVRDNGKGIPASVLEKIGEPGVTTKESGNGLGIPSAFDAVESWGGKVSVESEVDQGTCVSLFLIRA